MEVMIIAVDKHCLLSCNAPADEDYMSTISCKGIVKLYS